MTTGSRHLKRRRLRAPRENGAALVEPPIEQVGSLLDGNLRCRQQYAYDLQGRSLGDVSRECRRELVAEARRWTSQYGDVDGGPTGASTPIFLAGHQPGLFHPGVWFKNFVLSDLARRHGALAVNLLIDSDTVRAPSLRVPGGSIARPRLAAIPFDQSAAAVPYEERRILDRQLFADFARRATKQIAPLVSRPLVGSYWPMAVARMQRTDNLGACLAQSRHQLEIGWGATTLEIPQSCVCRMRSYGWFVAHLLAQLSRFRTIYNEVVDEYRRVNRIRSRAHPVPNLTRDGVWLEAPFWIWTADDPRRRPLFVRHRRDQIVLSDRRAREIALPLSADGDAARAVERLAELGAQGLKIRSRALLTTLWARLALGDLFVHGIGGAKYDEVTDAVIGRFFGLRPPGFLVVSATLHLPVDRKSANVEDAGAIERQLRELTYHPERYLNGADEAPTGCAGTVAELIAAKTRWIRTPQTPENARIRYREIRRINEALQPYVARWRKKLSDARRRAARALQAEAVLSCREYGFCLFPQRTLREFLFGLLHRIS